MSRCDRPPQRQERLVPSKQEAAIRIRVPMLQVFELLGTQERHGAVLHGIDEADQGTRSRQLARHDALRARVEDRLLCSACDDERT
ncbi:MAG TPA: hypothetical protein VNJ54_05515 [Plantibacter sp.]|uniref:hypothetical protein n=1 Tax=unclassified Plantibacter TaxID=2624265 RepID=UPI002CDF0344|nr:hypothetical protein [Plantibacter sp.]